jgi:hypothetical protein
MPIVGSAPPAIRAISRLIQATRSAAGRFRYCIS